MKDEVIRTPFIQQLLHLSSSSAVLSATDELFNHVDSGDYMWSGDGERRVEMSFIFKQPFLDVPVMSVALTGMDADQSTNLRFHVAAENVSATGFTAVFLTWDNTHIARASITWTAIGPIAQPGAGRNANNKGKA
ncbi:H-type lectin domain-containing protein [Pseudoruegeria sp. SHC-113]|uniref:H-type lectin domain-containing protein n=1 Tax=Pseudoruegeria sp. SHC-113 TaxID=2855439 RepID=UPI0021BB4F33|nr:H-type lectin domain-containing protein [Pseudoruegeria sp. SHC-113]MCT8159638.1 H-type lectin domain-containing protein [Pseudoruegeria sp. SHC-113]